MNKQQEKELQTMIDYIVAKTNYAPAPCLGKILTATKATIRFYAEDDGTVFAQTGFTGNYYNYYNIASFSDIDTLKAFINLFYLIKTHE